MDKVLLLGGVPGVGKSTFLRNYLPQTSVTHLRRNDLYVQLAIENNFDPKQMFEKVTRKEVDRLFIQKVKECNTAISDLHYAFPIGEYNRQNEYARCLEDDFIQSLLEQEIKVGAILLVADSDLVWDRLVMRLKDCGSLGSFTKEDLNLQMTAEQAEWERLRTQFGIQIYKINSANESELYSIVNDFFESNDEN